MLNSTWYVQNPVAWRNDGVVEGRRISDRGVMSSIPGCSAPMCIAATLGNLFSVHTHVPLFTKQYKLAPASAGGKVHHRSSVGLLAAIWWNKWHTRQIFFCCCLVFGFRFKADFCRLVRPPYSCLTLITRRGKGIVFKKKRNECSTIRQQMTGLNNRCSRHAARIAIR